MKKKIALAVLFFALIFPLSISANNQPRVYIAQIDGEIKAGTVQYLNRAIKESEAGLADYLIIKIDTPGGLLDSTKRIVDSMIKTDVKTVVFVNKSGGWAYSAGSFILIASDYAFSHPTATIGAAEPQIIGGGENQKIRKAMISWMESLALKNERDVKTARSFVEENVTLSGKEAFYLGVIDGIPNDLNGVFDLLEIYNPEIIIINPTFFENVFDILSHPYLISLFLTLGLLGLIFAFRTGEFEISGSLGLIFLAIGLWGIGVINFNILGVILLVLGVSLLAVELFSPGLGAFGIFGILSLTLGIFNFGAEPLMAPRIFDFATFFVIGVLISLLIFFIIVWKGVAKTHKAKPVTGSESLIGKRGAVIENISPLGRIRVEKESWAAKSYNNEKIEKSVIVEVIKVEGNTLVVKPIENN